MPAVRIISDPICWWPKHERPCEILSGSSVRVALQCRLPNVSLDDIDVPKYNRLEPPAAARKEPMMRKLARRESRVQKVKAFSRQDFSFFDYRAMYCLLMA